MKIVITLLLSVLVVTGINNGSTTNFERQKKVEPCVIKNPLADGQDPWVIKKEGHYYYIETRERGLYISKSKNLSDIKKDEQLVWELPGSGWNQSNLWAPELHFIQGKWYIYYTAGKSGPPFIHQRSGVLESKTDDPMGDYIDKGQLYTGNNVQTKENNIWSIDLTVFEQNGQLYGIWSGWEENRETDKTPQHLYIAEMDNPWTISSNRVKISSPVENWETGSELAINEGAQVLKNGDDLFVIYSASESWLPAYNLGQLRLVGEDPMNPDNWKKKGSVFEGTEDVHGVGHASFTTSPDGTEHWIVYHTKVSPDPGWERVIHLQPFNWNNDGSPNFGDPVPAGVSISKPSGACEE